MRTIQISDDTHGYVNLYGYIRKDVKGTMIFDIGASNGVVTKQFLDFGAEVISVEPLEDRTINSNFDGARAVINKCVSDKRGEVDFFPCKNSPNISTCYEDWKNGFHKNSSKWEAVRRKECITLDDLIEEYGLPFYIKIDVEGYEDVVLDGLSQASHMLSFEYTGGYQNIFERCIEKLRSLGYQTLIGFTTVKVKKRGEKIKLRYMHEFDSYEDCMLYYRNLKTYKQGDILAIC